MRAGQLDRTIAIQSFASGVADDYGTPVEAWTTVATVRAELVQLTAQERLEAFGENAALAVTFRIRWLEGITTAHRVQFDGRNLNIREVKEIGRRKGLELSCEEVRP